MRHTQHIVHEWMLDVFGAEAVEQFGPRIRALRFLEEAIELGQACGLTQLDVSRVARQVYEKPQGQSAHEIGGVMVTLAGVANSVGAVISECTAAELTRIRTPEVISRIRHRNSQNGDKIT